MIRWLIAIIACLPACALVAGAAAPAVVRARNADAQVKANEEQRKAAILQAKQTIQASKSVGTFHARDLLRLRMRGGQITGEWLQPAGEVVDGRLVSRTLTLRYDIKDSSAVWLVSNRSGAVPYTRVVRYKLDDEPGRPYMIGLSLTATNVSINASYAPGSSLYTMNFVQSPQGVTLSTSDANSLRGRPTPQLRAASFDELRARYPAEVQTLLEPVMRSIAEENWLKVGPADAYRIFDTIPAAPADQERFESVLARLDAPEFTEREKASAELAAMGRAATIPALRVDEDELHPEQRVRLDAFLDAQSTRVIEDVAKARTDVDLLLECVEDDDSRVRAAAVQLLDAQLRRPSGIDISAKPQELSKAVQALRIELVKSRPAPPPDKPKVPAIQRLLPIE